MPYTVRLQVNGVPVGEYRIESGFVDLTIPIALEENDNPIEFVVNEPPHSAAELGLGQDTRRVSVGISRLSIEPTQP